MRVRLASWLVGVVCWEAQEKEGWMEGRKQGKKEGRKEDRDEWMDGCM